MTPTSAPRHVAIIMDGNGRWAQQRGFIRTWGHRHGAKRVDEIVTACCEAGVEYLTLYAFSTENWSRPEAEVSLLMRLLVRHLKSMDKKLVANRVSLSVQGQIERLPAYVRTEIDRVIRATQVEKPALRLCLSLSYGGRQELVDCFRSLADRVARGEIRPDQIDEDAIRSHLYQPSFPDPDLLIRTGGEFRISNFLLWQLAYSELYVTGKLWPDFHREDLMAAFGEFGARQRRFGKTGEQVRIERRIVQPPPPGPDRRRGFEKSPKVHP